MLKFVKLSSKMGFDVRVEIDTDSGLYVASNAKDGRAFAVSADPEIALWTAWRDISGFVPFSVVRRRNGRFVNLGIGFRPAAWSVRQVNFPRSCSFRVQYNERLA